jgi:hypothetical protein
LKQIMTREREEAKSEKTCLEMRKCDGVMIYSSFWFSISWHIMTLCDDQIN